MTDFISQVKTLTDAWPAKLLATAAGVIFSEVFQLHLHLLLLFAVLEFVDCVSKWLALSYARIKDMDCNAKPTLIECAEGIPAAHRCAYIQSEVMRKQFYSKMLTYLILIIAAGTGDYIIRLTHRPDILLSAVVAYISATELLSVLENLNDAGASIAGALIAIVKSRMPGGTPPVPPNGGCGK